MDVVQHDYDFMFKIFVIGNYAAGKSSLIIRFVDQIFYEKKFRPFDFRMKLFDCQDKSIKLYIWDFANEEERYRAVSSSSYKGHQAFILAYDITDRKSFTEIDYWLQQIKKHAVENVICFLVGNKSDLETDRQVTQEEGLALANKLGIQFFETSARSNMNVDRMFQTLTEQIIKKQIIEKTSFNSYDQIECSNTYYLLQEKPKKLVCCCIG